MPHGRSPLVSIFWLDYGVLDLYSMIAIIIVIASAIAAIIFAQREYRRAASEIALASLCFQGFLDRLLGMITNHPEELLLRKIFRGLELFCGYREPGLSFFSHTLFCPF